MNCFIFFGFNLNLSNFRLVNLLMKLGTPSFWWLLPRRIITQNSSKLDLETTMCHPVMSLFWSLYIKLVSCLANLFLVLQELLWTAEFVILGIMISICVLMQEWLWVSSTLFLMMFISVELVEVGSLFSSDQMRIYMFFSVSLHFSYMSGGIHVCIKFKCSLL